MKKTLTENNLFKPPKMGEIVEGTIINKSRSCVFLDLGHFGTGVIYGREFQEAKDAQKDLKIGDNISAKIVGLENEEGYIELSISQASNDLTWGNLNQKKETGKTLVIKILGANKGGLLTEVSGIPAFLPLSQLSPANYPKVEGGNKSKILEELQKFIGKEMEVKIFDLDPEEEKLILSEKAKETEKIREFLKNYKIGDVVEGEITGIVDFGVFIRFPASGKTGSRDGAPEKLDGLIHISELDWQLIENPSEVVKIGQTVKAKIVDIADDKVSLSLKALKKDPWEDIEKKYKKGDTVNGKVTKLNPFGAFVQISPRIQGLCHISEFSSGAQMKDFLEINKKYSFQVLLIDPERHRINLKLVE